MGTVYSSMSMPRGPGHLCGLGPWQQGREPQRARPCPKADGHDGQLWPTLLLMLLRGPDRPHHPPVISLGSCTPRKEGQPGKGQVG